MGLRRSVLVTARPKRFSHHLMGLSLLAMVGCVSTGKAPSSRPTARTWECMSRDTGEPRELCGHLRAVSKPNPFAPSGGGLAAPRGRVVLVGRIEHDGSVTGLQVVASDDARLNPPSLAAVGQWRYEPPTCAGKAVSVTLSVTVDFHVGEFKTKIPRPTCSGNGER